MYFTREPVIETVVTSREGYKLSVRNTKHLSQDPFIVEAIEVIRLGNTCFFRNCDHSKPFLVPAGDYEVMEVRDAKINLKAVGLDRGVKIAGGRDSLLKLTKVSSVSEEKPIEKVEEELPVVTPAPVLAPASKKKKEFSKGEKWKEKKKQGRRRNSKEIAEAAGASQEILETVAEEMLQEAQDGKKFSLLPPPPKLISEVLTQSDDIDMAAADLNASLDALVHESSEVLDALLTGNQPTVLSDLGESSTQLGASFSEILPSKEE